MKSRVYHRRCRFEFVRDSETVPNAQVERCECGRQRVVSKVKEAR